ncbi:uncharacterized protein BJ212DRAFT_1303340 [Suillus subaureus]|uniref:Uncharacterized protein n=1 Tax=Suillus subaureus TaxID=48587 RepID=A0A9P7E0T4_9AGAM|nr:uncharacterized protein BJ212DRAFT_1303340 [Suillus subaureus]KAG1807619.1 hypothetical protein BJ212DRAFT_1303340 [Suillus subaureus]
MDRMNGGVMTQSKPLVQKFPEVSPVLFWTWSGSERRHLLHGRSESFHQGNNQESRVRNRTEDGRKMLQSGKVTEDEDGCVGQRFGVEIWTGMDGRAAMQSRSFGAENSEGLEVSPDMEWKWYQQQQRSYELRRYRVEWKSGFATAQQKGQRTEDEGWRLDGKCCAVAEGRYGVEAFMKKPLEIWGVEVWRYRGMTVLEMVGKLVLQRGRNKGWQGPTRFWRLG